MHELTQETKCVSDIQVSHNQIDKISNQMTINLGFYKERGKWIPKECPWEKIEACILEDRYLRENLVCISFDYETND